MLLHAYGVVAAGSRLPEGMPGRQGGTPRLVADDELAVVVSELDDQARVGRDDLVTHAHLLEALAERDTVVPLRFGVVLPDEETVRREFLDRQRAELKRLLETFDGLIQLTVRAGYEEEAALREVVTRDPALAAPAGRDMAAQIARGEAVAAGLAALRDHDEDLFVQALAPHAEATVVEEVRGAYEVARLFFLVRRQRRSTFDAMVSQLRDEAPERLRIRYVGPQPPYAFLDHATQEQHA